ncbi:hypothetical protein HDU79_001451 [Rhizoclosmatium sp. JEL0117]|nr:hypothetical protein HDU79_001451 [Rhizoclosmatium sp. JEL0117]
MIVVTLHRPANSSDTHTSTLLTHLSINSNNSTLVHCITDLLIPSRAKTFNEAVTGALPSFLGQQPATATSLVVDGIASVLGLPGESVGTVLKGLQSLLDLCGEKYTSIVLVNHLALSSHSGSVFSFADVLDTLAQQVYRIEEVKEEERRIWNEGWVVVDAFVLKSSGVGVYGRIRKGSVKERIALRTSPANPNKVESRLVADLLSEIQPLNYEKEGISIAAAVTVSSTAATPQAVPDVSKLNDPTHNLSFNLKLTEEQRQMKDNTVLPYMHTGEGVGGTVGVAGGAAGGIIHYEADAYDDDEGDPDDDLAL